MAITRTIAHDFIRRLGAGGVFVEDAAFRAILMAQGFTFDPANHKAYGHVLAQEVAAGNGYGAGGQALVTQQPWTVSAGGKASIVWQSAFWVANGGNIGPAGSAIILAWNAGMTASSPIVGCIDFGENLTIEDGFSFLLQDLGFDLAQAA